jgi:hypothetical protein
MPGHADVGDLCNSTSHQALQQDTFEAFGAPSGYRRRANLLSLLVGGRSATRRSNRIHALMNRDGFRGGQFSSSKSVHNKGNTVG